MIGRLSGTVAVVRRLPGQRRIPFLPRERVAELRDARVRAMVEHAAATVPYYRDYFAETGIDPRELRSAEDLERLPLIDKQTVLEDPARFRSGAIPDGETTAFTTSGSSWRALTVRHDRRSLLENIAYSERQRAVEAKLAGKRLRYVVATIAHETLTGRDVDTLYRKSTLRVGPRRVWIPLDESVEGVIARISRLRPDVLSGFGSYLEELFRIVADRDLSLHLPRVVSYAGDPMSDEGKELIETRFGVPVFSAYAAVEAFKIGYFCEQRTVFHLYDDLCPVRIVGPDGRTLGFDEPGEVVISNLVNRATVLLNYRLGDLARLRDDTCPCGRTSPVLAALEGRVSEIVHLPGGDIVHPFAVLSVIRRFKDVRRSQLVQHERDRFELRVATVDPATFARIREPLARELGAVLRDSALELTHHQQLDGTGRRKFVPVVALKD